METQQRFRGMWKIPFTEGCPHRKHYAEGIDVCEENEMRPCLYETGNGPCEVFQEILKEWREELDKADVVQVTG